MQKFSRSSAAGLLYLGKIMEVSINELVISEKKNILNSCQNTSMSGKGLKHKNTIKQQLTGLTAFLAYYSS